MTQIIGAGREITKDYNTIFFHEEDDIRVNKIEMWMAKTIGETLVKHYPQRQWNVNVDALGGLVVIMCPSLSHNKGYHMHISGDTLQKLCERSVNAAGEILERYGIGRSKKFNPDDLETIERVGPHEEAVSPDAVGIHPIIGADG